jgi:hypothetical protein
MTRGCVHNVKEVDMMQRRQRRREPTTSDATSEGVT